MLHILKNGRTKLGTLQQLRARQQPLEIIGNRFFADGALEPGDNQVGRLVPTHMAEHHLPRENHRTRIHLILPSVLGCGSMGGFKQGVTGIVVDITAGTIYWGPTAKF